MVRYLIERPVAVIISFLALVIVGLITTRLLPVSLLPEVKIPEITVYISHPNTNAPDLERTVVSGMRARLQQLPGLNDITSETRDNNAVIRLRFEYGTNTDYSFIEVNDKIDAAMAGLPREIRRPKIIKASTTDLPVFLLNLSLKDSSHNHYDDRFNQLSNFAETVIRRRIEQLNSVAFADITGLSSQGLYIIPDDSKMQSLNVQLTDITNALDQNNASVNGIIVREGQLQYSLMFRNELRTVVDVKNLIVNVHNNPVLLGELAQVGIRAQDPGGMFLSQGKRAVCMALVKSSGSTIETMRDEVKSLTDQLISEYPDIQFETSQDQSFLLTYTIDNLKNNLLQGAFLAIIILFLFIRNYRSPFLIALTLPVTLVISLFFFYLLGISINIVSLSGLILGVGMMIDNSIVVIDNIIQHRGRGENLIVAVTKGTNEVIAPMISSTLTSCAIFIPLIFLSGISGALFYDQAIAIAIGQGISLIVSITLTPTLFHLLHHKVHNHNEIKLLNKFKLFDLENGYVRGFDFVLRHQWITFAVLCIILAGGYLAFIKIDKRQLPILPQKETVLDIDWNENIHPIENSKRIQLLLSHVREEVLQSNAFIGEQQFVLNRNLDMSAYESQIYLKAASSGEIGVVESKLKSYLSHNYPEASFKFNPPENPFTKIFSVNEGMLTARLTGENSDSPIPLQQVRSIAAEIAQHASVPSKGIPVRSQYLITAKSEMLFHYDVDYSEVLSQLTTAFNNNITSNLKAVDRYIPIIIGSEPVSMQNVLNKLFINNRSGQKIPVKHLVNVEMMNDYRTIYGGPEGVFVPVNLQVRANNTKNVIRDVQTIVQKRQGMEVSFSGSYFGNRKLISEMAIILLISVLLLYFILAAQFESLIIPWIVLIELPIDIAFAAIILLVAGNSINAMSMIGFVVMGGIIINDSILKIDTINQLRRGGMDLLTAIHEGGRRRLKPIIMTALVTVIALLPQMFGSDMGAKLQLPLSLTMLAGMTAGTFVSIWIIPLLYFHTVTFGIAKPQN